ncbi:MAG: hypothetical protein R3B07_20205 [Polyangiaceae bacterium]
MKRVWLLGATLLSSMALGGCPLYPDEPAYCDYNSDCGSGFVCNGYGECIPMAATTSSARRLRNAV